MFNDNEQNNGTRVTAASSHRGVRHCEHGKRCSQIRSDRAWEKQTLVSWSIVSAQSIAAFHTHATLFFTLSTPSLEIKKSAGPTRPQEPAPAIPSPRLRIRTRPSRSRSVWPVCWAPRWPPRRRPRAARPSAPGRSPPGPSCTSRCRRCWPPRRSATTRPTPPPWSSTRRTRTRPSGRARETSRPTQTRSVREENHGRAAMACGRNRITN